ncbi:MAG: 3-deoxy-manno-octulosonate cytidylyltransferase [Deltaproteobacteria bacterium]|nr:3-deoxy-manno-octulosonate cytidylyltransferase [Deltaproteobacteria bacterium]
MSSVVAVIPARFASTRLPGKPLLDLQGKPMIQRVYERAAAAAGVDEVLVATDDERSAAAVARFGGRAMLTGTHHRSGTERTAEVAQRLTAPLIINVQGDEPLLDPVAITQALRPLLDDEEVVMSTLRAPLMDETEYRDPNVVKVVVDQHDYALYFSRAPLPFVRGGAGAPCASRHIGLYVYRREFLLKLAAFPPTPLEEAEGLEQLRALEHGFRIKVVPTACQALGVDTPEDLARVRAILAAEAGQRPAQAAQGAPAEGGPRGGEGR